MKINQSIAMEAVPYLFRLCFCLLLIGLPQVSLGSAKPNIVILLVDDMGYGDPQCFNPRSKIATPNIDRLAREGMRFTDAHAPGPLCHPSRYGLMTGRYPFRTDITRWPNQPLIEKGQMTIASLLKTAGYHTAMVGKWHLGFREAGYDQPLRGGPVDCGFDSFFGLRASTDISPYFYIRGDRAVIPPTNHIAEHHSEGWASNQGEFWREGGIAPDLELKDVLPRLTEEACAVISAQAGKKPEVRQPLMLHLAYPAPHTPWLPAAEFAGKSGAGMYGDFATMVDAQIGRVLAALEKAGMMQDTLLVFASDNGPVWHPADVARLGHDAAGGLRGMKGDVWEAGHRMPFIVRWPGRVKAGTDKRPDDLLHRSARDLRRCLRGEIACRRRAGQLPVFCRCWKGDSQWTNRFAARS
jgi:arylsulfatase A